MITCSPSVSTQVCKDPAKLKDILLCHDTVKVVTTDIPASNGVIHVIDAVLLPPAM
jgi:hypothetical protein